MRGIVLGSSSKSRQYILKELGYDFTIIQPNINEKNIGDRTITSLSSPSELVLQIARAKTHALLSSQVIPIELMSNVLVTADTVVVHQNQILEKPLTEVEFRQNMKSYSNSFCTLYSSLIVTDLNNGKQIEVSVTFLLFLPHVSLRASMWRHYISMKFLKLQ